MRLDLIFDLRTRPSEDVATAADVLDMVGWKEEAEMFRCKLRMWDMSNCSNMASARD